MTSIVAIATLIVFAFGFCISVLGIDEHDPYVLAFGVACIVAAALILVIH